MDDAPYTGDLDLDAVSTRDDLATLLRAVHIRADKPSLRVLEARTRHGVTPLSKTAVAEMLKGVRFPRKAVMVAFLGACGLEDNDMDPWRRTWERVAAREEKPTRSPNALSGRRSELAAANAETETQVQSPDGGRVASGPIASVGAAGMKELREQIDKLLSDNKKLRSQLATPDQPAAEDFTSGQAVSGQGVRSPIVRRRELGALLRALRVDKGMPVEQVADHLMCSSTKVRRMETNFRSGTVRDVRDLCDLYGVTEAAQRDHLMELARQGKQQGWWQPYNLPFSTYVGLEAGAASIRGYHSMVPGLFQTRITRARYIKGLRQEMTQKRRIGGSRHDLCDSAGLLKLIRQTSGSSWMNRHCTGWSEGRRS